MRYAVIMAGGSGTRLWPMSTAQTPKQLIPFLNDRCLLEIAADRLNGMIDADKQFICTGESFRAPIHRNMPDFPDAQILGEPTGRDTLNAVGFAAAVLGKTDPDAVIAVFTADHLIEPVHIFQERVNEAFRIAESQDNTLVTFGIRPSHPATGFGYVQLADPLEDFERAYAVKQFKEKPDQATAREYVDSGQYLWNSGMFVWRAQTLSRCIEQYAPQAAAGLKTIAEAWGTANQKKVLNDVYPKLPKISVDFAVMEPASNDPKINVATVELAIQWLDVGSWPAYGETCPNDAHNNRISNKKTALMDTENTLVVGNDPDHLIATIGVKDLVVVHTPHATLICHKDKAQKIKEMHYRAKEEFGEKYV